MLNAVRCVRHPAQFFCSHWRFSGLVPFFFPTLTCLPLACRLVQYLRLRRISSGGFMKILAAIKREQKKLEKHLGKIQHQLNGVRAAAKALGDSTSKELKVVKKRVLSAAARARIGRATKKRWAKFRALKKKVTG